MFEDPHGVKMNWNSDVFFGAPSKDRPWPALLNFNMENMDNNNNQPSKRVNVKRVEN